MGVFKKYFSVNNDSVPKRIWNKIRQAERKLVSYPFENKLKQFKQKREDEIQNRELLIVDKYGNRYYQHYSKEGIPTKRYAHLNMTSFNKWNEDPTMMAWLAGRRESPPSQEELEKIYIQQEEMERRGLEYDRKEQRLIEDYKNKRKIAIEIERKETGAIGFGDNFTPGKWLKNLESSEVATLNNPLTEIPKFDVTNYNNIHGLKGKYLVDFEKDDIEYMNKISEYRLAPYLNKIAEMGEHKLKEFTSISAASDRYHKELKEKEERIKKLQLESTELGIRMLEKKDKFKKYSEFRIRFNDVFDSVKI